MDGVWFVRGAGFLGQVTGGVVSKGRSGIPHSSLWASSSGLLLCSWDTKGVALEIFSFTFLVISFDFLMIIWKMSCDSSGLQTNHQDSLTGLCRICGERARRKYEKSIPKLCADYKSDIFQVYRLNGNGDDTDRHPTEICIRCYEMMKKALRTKDMKTLDNTSQPIVGGSIWLLHTDKNRSECTHYGKQDKGGRSAKDRWLRRRQHEASESTLSFDPPDRSTSTTTKNLR